MNIANQTSSITRRRWLAQSALAGAPGATVHDIKTISHQPDVYHGWPTVTRRRNGELLVVWSGGRAGHVCPFGRVDMMRSRDNGDTWSEPITISDDGASVELGYPSTVRLDDGRLLTVWYEKPADSPRAVLRQARWSI